MQDQLGYEYGSEDEFRSRENGDTTAEICEESHANGKAGNKIKQAQDAYGPA